MQHYRFVHIFWINETAVKFAPNIIRMISNSENGFQANEHLFVTPHKHVYENIHELGNVLFIEQQNFYDATLIDRCASMADWIIVHGMAPIHYALKIKRKCRKKIVWRTWGHDVGYSYCPGKPLKNTVKKMLELAWKREVRSFYAVGIGNVIDEIDIKKRFGNVRTYRMGYPSQGTYEMLKDALDRRCEFREENVLNVMVGHSGYQQDNHAAIMQLLDRYKAENMEVYFVLSYGDKVYISNLKKMIIEQWGTKAIIIEDFLPKSEYIDLLSRMDIVFLDGVKSHALGNISLLLNLGKKLFVNRNGVIKQAFDMENIPYFCIDEVKNMTFSQFKEPLDYKLSAECDFVIHDYSFTVNKWHRLLNDLKNDVEGATKTE